MTVQAKREKLINVINRADVRKINALFTVLENDINKEMNWWEDKEFIDEMDSRVQNVSSGKDKGFTLSQSKKRTNMIGRK